MKTDVEVKQDELMEKQKEVREKQQELMHANHKESVDNAQQYNKSMQLVSRVTKILDTVVKNSNGDSLGDIKDLVVNPEDGHIAYAVIAFGGVFGMGNKYFAIPWRTLHWNCDTENYVLNIDKSSLEKAPGFDKDHWPDSSNKWELLREEIDQFYCAQP
jgi:sporulation protein YlmC with PRC-barrel domain